MNRFQNLLNYTHPSRHPLKQHFATLNISKQNISEYLCIGNNLRLVGNDLVSILSGGGHLGQLEVDGGTIAASFHLLLLLLLVSLLHVAVDHVAHERHNGDEEEQRSDAVIADGADRTLTCTGEGAGVVVVLGRRQGGDEAVAARSTVIRAVAVVFAGGERGGEGGGERGCVRWC
jgi:hypothetical protein